MINALINSIFNVIFSILRAIDSILMAPLNNFLQTNFPDINNFISDFNNFMITYVYKGILFVKEVFLNITGFPRELWTTFIGFIFLLITFSISLIPIFFIYNGIRTIRGRAL